MDFESNIKQWVSIDSTIKGLNEQLKQQRMERNNLGTNIYQYIETNNLHHAVIQISDGTLKFQQTKITQPLTLKFVKDCLNESLGDDSKVDEIMNYIKEQRDVRYTSDIKRSYK
jgi:ferritin